MSLNLRGLAGTEPCSRRMMFDRWHQTGLASEGEDKSPGKSKDQHSRCVGVVWVLVNLPFLLSKHLVEA